MKDHDEARNDDDNNNNNNNDYGSRDLLLPSPHQTPSEALTYDNYCAQPLGICDLALRWYDLPTVTVMYISVLSGCCSTLHAGYVFLHRFLAAFGPF